MGVNRLRVPIVAPERLLDIDQCKPFLVRLTGAEQKLTEIKLTMHDIISLTSLQIVMHGVSGRHISQLIGTNMKAKKNYRNLAAVDTLKIDDQ